MRTTVSFPRSAACHPERTTTPCHSERSEESAFPCFFVEASKSRFLVAPLLGMTGLGGTDPMSVVWGPAHLVLLLPPVTLPSRVHLPPCHLERRSLPLSSLASRGICSSEPPIAQVQPYWVSRLDQSNLLRTSPRLDLFFARDRCTNAAEVFVIHQPVHVVPCGKARKKLLLVLGKAPLGRGLRPRTARGTCWP